MDLCLCSVVSAVPADRVPGAPKVYLDELFLEADLTCAGVWFDAVWSFVVLGYRKSWSDAIVFARRINATY